MGRLTAIVLGSAAAPFAMELPVSSLCAGMGRRSSSQGADANRHCGLAGDDRWTLINASPDCKSMRRPRYTRVAVAWQSLAAWC
jgi:hypothetical protein